jgi:hypothetical protein
LTTTEEAYKIVVEDIAFCKKTVAPPDNVSALQYDSSALVNWKDGSATKPFSLPQLQGATGAMGLVARKSNGDFVYINGATAATGATGVLNVMANIGSQWITTTINLATGGGGSGQPTGAVGNPVFYENDQIVTGNYTITSNKNAMSAGPITVNAGVIVTVPAGSVWTVV